MEPQDKGTLQKASHKLRDVLRSHAKGERTLRDMAARIAARAEEKKKIA